MSVHDAEWRRSIAVQARACLERRITYVQFINSIDENQDEDVSKLEFLMEHIPAESGLFGPLFGNSKKEVAAHMQEIETVIKKLEAT